MTREELAEALARKFAPEIFDETYQEALMEQGFPRRTAIMESSMVVFIDSDGQRSLRPLSFGEIADALLEVIND